MIKIPHEKISETPGSRFSKKQPKSFTSASIRKKMDDKQSLKDQKIIGQTALELVKYLKAPHTLRLEQLNDLTHNMQRSILCLQRHKKKIVDKNSKKK